MPDPASPPHSPPAWRRTTPHQIGEYRVHPASNELETATARTRIPPRLMDVLLRLAHAPGAVVSRETLIEDVWPRKMVNDEVLSRTIADLRAALGDEARQARYIETLPKAGYRLVAAVAELPAEAAAATAPPTGKARNWQRAMLVTTLLIVAVSLAFWQWPRSVPPVSAEALGQQIASAEALSSDPQLELGPRFAADMTHMAWVTGSGESAALVILDLANDRRRRIGTTGTVWLSPVFAGPGALVAQRRRAGECVYVRIDLATDQQRDLFPCQAGDSARFDISPDGKTLVVARRREPQVPHGLVLIDLATGKSRALTLPEPGQGNDLAPRFHPDGSKVAFFRGTASHQQLWLVDVAPPHLAKPLVKTLGLSYGAAWLPDGSRLVAAADWTGFRALHLVNANGSTQLLGGRGAQYPEVSTRGDIVFESASYRANIWRLDVKTGRSDDAPLWPSTRYTSQPALSLDGRMVAMVSNRDGSEGLYIAERNGELRKLPLPQGYRYIRPHWAPDGASLYATRIPREDIAGKANVAVRIRIADASVDVLDALGNDVVGTRASADGKWLYFAKHADHAFRLFRAPPTDLATQERLPLPLVSEYHLTRDRLIFAQPQLTGLTACELATLACRPLDVPVDDGTRFDWVASRSAVWFLQREGPGNKLARFDLASGKVTWQSEFAPTAMGINLAVSPDEREVLVARSDAPEIDLMIARATPTSASGKTAPQSVK